MNSRGIWNRGVCHQRQYGDGREFTMSAPGSFSLHKIPRQRLDGGSTSRLSPVRVVRGCTPEIAGARFARLAAQYNFTLYEHFITDRIGHNQTLEWARHHMISLTRFVRSVLAEAGLTRQTVVVTSDHGNIEDVITRGHTLNPVATLAFGPAREAIASRLGSLIDITPTIVRTLKAHFRAG
jgi:hypothetical protein